MNEILKRCARRRTPATRAVLLLPVALLALALPVPADARGKEPPPDLVAALDATGDAETARRAAETLLAEYKNHPRSGDAAEILGHYYYARGEYVTAARQFERAAGAVAPGPGLTRRQCLRGRAFLGAREGGLAARVFEGVLKQDPRSSEAQLGLADAMALQGKAERAADIYRDIAAHGTADAYTPLALAQLMWVADALGRPADARAAAATLARDYPQSSEAAAARDRLRREAPRDEPAPSPAAPARAPRKDRAPAKTPPRAPAEPRGTTTAPAAPPADTAITSGRFTLQLGAFGDRENARELASHLEAWGLAGVRIEEETRGGRVYFRVRAGDYPDREAATAAGIRLNAEHGVSFRIVEP